MASSYEVRRFLWHPLLASAVAKKLQHKDSTNKEAKLENVNETFQKKSKRTETPSTVDTPDSIAETPEMNVETPDTPETPDTRGAIPALIETPSTVDTPNMTVDTVDTPDSSGGFSVSGSGEESSGYESESVESGRYYPMHWLKISPYAAINKTKGDWDILWHPKHENATITVKGPHFYRESNVTEEPKEKDDEKIIKEGSNANKEDPKIKQLLKSPSLTNASSSLLLDHAMLDNFMSVYGKSNIPHIGMNIPYRTKIRRTNLSKFRFGVENFVRRNILSVENFVRRNFVR